MFHPVDHPSTGRYLTPGTPFSFGTVPRAAPRPAPPLGAHTEEILADVARLPDTEIATLFDAGIVSQAKGARRLAS